MPTQGILFALDRDAAKQCFSSRGDELMSEFMTNLVGNGELVASGRRVNCAGHWNVLHRCFSDGSLEPTAGELPLNQCFLGGRPMYQGGEKTVALVRPDMVGHVATELAKTDEPDLHQRCQSLADSDLGRVPEGDELSQLWQKLQEVREFYQKAAEDGCAVVFYLENE